jgi:uncharacterized alkaline shock family protein YloU
MSRVDGHSVISTDVLASYAADAAREVDGVAGLVESSLHRHRGVRILEDDGESVAVEIHVRLDWDAAAADVGRGVQERVAAYLGRMAELQPRAIDVIVDEVAPPPAG